MNHSLENKVAVVTGAGGKTGAAMALALAGAGARVLVNDINPDRVARVVETITQEGGAAKGLTADVSNRFQCANLIENTREQWGRLDILVNNASVQPIFSVLKMDEWAWQRCFDVNLKGAFFMCQLVGRVMADENQGRGGIIINMSTAVEMFSAGHAAYAASKAGLEAFTRECAREYAPMGIHVNLLPGGSVYREQEGGLEKGRNSATELTEELLRLCNDTLSSES